MREHMVALVAGASAWVLLCTNCESGATNPSDTVARISIGSSAQLVEAGDSLEISAVALSADGHVVSGLPLIWTTSDSAIVVLRNRSDQGVELVTQGGGVIELAGVARRRRPFELPDHLHRVAAVQLRPALDADHPDASGDCHPVVTAS